MEICQFDNFYVHVFISTNIFVLGHVGPPVPFCRIKLADVPELDYFAKDGKGEVTTFSIDHLRDRYSPPTYFIFRFSYIPNCC